MNSQKGFIQIPILIAIIVGLFVVGGAGYVGVKQYQSHQQVQKVTEEAKPQNEHVTATSSEQSEVEKLRQEVEDLKKQQIEQKAAPKSSVESSQKSQTQTVVPTPTKTPIVNTPSVPDYRVQAYKIMDTAIDNYFKLLTFSSECAVMAKQRKSAVQSLASDRDTWLPKLAFDAKLYEQQKTLYDLYDAEIAVMNDYQNRCEVLFPNVLNNNINNIHASESALQNSVAPVSSEQLYNYQTAYAESKIVADRSAIQVVIDKINSMITKTNVVYKQSFDAMNTYVNNVLTPTALPTQFIAPAPVLPQMPQTTHCTISGDGGVGLQLYVNCTTSSF